MTASSSDRLLFRNFILRLHECTCKTFWLNQLPRARLAGECDGGFIYRSQSSLNRNAQSEWGFDCFLLEPDKQVFNPAGNNVWLSQETSADHALKNIAVSHTHTHTHEVIFELDGHELQLSKRAKKPPRSKRTADTTSMDHKQSNKANINSPPLGWMLVQTFQARCWSTSSLLYVIITAKVGRSDRNVNRRVGVWTLQGSLG